MWCECVLITQSAGIVDLESGLHGRLDPGMEPMVLWPLKPQSWQEDYDIMPIMAFHHFDLNISMNGRLPQVYVCLYSLHSLAMGCWYCSYCNGLEPN